MSRELVQEILVPAMYGRAWHVNKGQSMRIIAVDGPQVGDLIAFNAHDYKESYDPEWSYIENCHLGTGDATHIRYLYSRPPRMNLMLEVVDDPIMRNWCLVGSRCAPLSYKLRGIENPERSCFGNLAEAIAPYGLEPDNVPYVFNLWMNVKYDPKGAFDVIPPLCRKGDYIEFLAHMDCLVALSACPADVQNMIPINMGLNKPLKVELYEDR